MMFQWLESLVMIMLKIKKTRYYVIHTRINNKMDGKFISLQINFTNTAKYVLLESKIFGK